MGIPNFYNHSGDNRPSSYVRGDFKKLVLIGRQAPKGKFFIPDDMTANELGDYLADYFGRPGHLSEAPYGNLPEQACHPDPAQQTVHHQPPRLESGRPGLPPNVNFLDPRRRKLKIEMEWPLPMRGLPLAQVMAEYRTKLMGAVAACRDFDGMYSDCVILSGEGIGKTTAHMHLTVQEALFTALDSHRGDPHRQFSVFRISEPRAGQGKGGRGDSANRGQGSGHPVILEPL